MTAATTPQYARRRVGDSELWVIPREEFASTRFDYKAGQHVVFAGPTTKGKTTFAFVLLEYVATPQLPAYVAISKPKDPATEKGGARLGFRRVTNWPVPRTVKEVFGEKPAGYLIWPKFGDIDNDPANTARITRALLKERYTAGVKNQQGILVLDDTVIKSKVLGLDTEMVTILTMAAAMGIGMWAFVQKPTDAGSTAIWSFSQSEHVFITYDGDAGTYKRYSEIGGVSPKFIAEAVRCLRPYEFLYFKRTENYLCIVGAK